MAVKNGRKKDNGVRELDYSSLGGLEQFLRMIKESPIVRVTGENGSTQYDERFYKSGDIDFLSHFGFIPYSFDNSTRKLRVLVNQNFDFKEKFCQGSCLYEGELAEPESPDYLNSLEGLLRERMWIYAPYFFERMPKVYKDVIQHTGDLFFEFVDGDSFTKVIDFAKDNRIAKQYFTMKKARIDTDKGVLEGSDNDDMELQNVLCQILTYAVNHRATDIHFELAKKSCNKDVSEAVHHSDLLSYHDDDEEVEAYVARLRIDGHLEKYPYIIPQRRYEGLVNVICQNCATPLDVTNSFTPQDGQMVFSSAFFDETKEARPYDVRVSLIPTQGSRYVNLRIQQEGTCKSLSELGFSPHVEVGVRSVAKEPHGIILVTGPTGSGKSTTLYSLLNEINSGDKKTITIEQPVEMKIDNIMQIDINEAQGMSFQKSLRSILRHDPDRILVGEIRDKETADLAIDAALTGHLVLSTLHTNDAPSAVRRLLSLGVDPFAYGSALRAIMAQRLVNTFSPTLYRDFQSKSQAYITAQQDGSVDLETATWEYQQLINNRGLELIDVAPRLNELFREEIVPADTYYGLDGPSDCFSGRTAITEYWKLGKTAQEMIIGGDFTDAVLRQTAIVEDAMEPLVVNGLKKALEHRTSLQKVIEYVGETAFYDNKELIKEKCF